ncbi:hypothetical protein [Streptomyces sp. NPDC006355]|uniref:hypothetical protein n=1 Tax=Streptomyces sp. NPDC006355 TaxID=3156758 RepID=UPI0033A227E9
MAQFGCGGSRCTCVVQAGPGVTVTGNGSSSAPYVIGAGGGGAVTCDQVRPCISAGDGAAYDPVTGVVSARPSTDPGNNLSFGTDGGLLVPAGGTTALTAGDTDTVDTTVAGSGTAADPYVVSSTVILDPTPPQGGTNLIGSGTEGLFLECADVRGCFTAGDGIAYDATTGEIAARVSTDAGNQTVIGTDGGIYTPAGSSTALTAGDTNTVDTTVTGSGTAADPYVVAADVIVAPEPNGLEATADGLLVAPSADAGNQLTMGTDGRLFVPPDAPLEVGCGLQGDGTAAAPLAAFPVAGEQPWTDDWDCDPAVHSTLRCDPGTGALWTPPEHTSSAVTFQQSHPVAGLAFTNTGGFVLVSNDAWSEGRYTADSLTTCRGVSFSTRFTGHLEVSWTANATFDVGYAVQVDGGALSVRITHSVLAPGAAGRERWSFTVSEAAVLPPHTGKVVRVYPAIRVTAGTATIQQWITDTDLIALTR